MTKVLLRRVVAYVVVFLSVSVSLAGDKVVVPPSVKNTDEILQVLKRLERYTSEQLELLPLIHIQTVTIDSTGVLAATTHTMVDSLGNVVRFRSATEYLVIPSSRGRWQNNNRLVDQAVIAYPVTDSSFTVARISSTYWDTISIVAIGARRIR